MSTRALHSAVLLLGFLFAASASEPPALQFSISANLDGSQEVPAATTSGSGFFSATLIRPKAKCGTDWNLTWSMNVTGLSGNITGGHIHTGGVGVNGGVIINFSGFNLIGQTSGFGTGSLIVSEAIATQLSEFESATYTNVHTTQFKGGEIRGKVEYQGETHYPNRGCLDIPGNGHQGGP